MASYRKQIWLLILAMLALVPARGVAQEAPINPYPEGPSIVDEAQLFGPSEAIPYGGGSPKSNRGYFFTADYLIWDIAGSKTVDIGAPGFHPLEVNTETFSPAYNSTNTSAFNSQFKTGQRYEFGYQDDDWGWVASMFMLQSLNQRFNAQNAEVVFHDTYTQTPFFDSFIQPDGSTGFFPTFSHAPVGYLDGFVNIQAPNLAAIDSNLNGNSVFGRYYDGTNTGVIDPGNPKDELLYPYWDLHDLARLKVQFTLLDARKRTVARGFELMPYWRSRSLHFGGRLELMGGARYFRWGETYNVLGSGGILGDSEWFTAATNDIIGPQVGARWKRQFSRWSWSTEGRFLAGWNLQNVRQNGILGSNLPTMIAFQPQNVLFRSGPLYFQNFAHMNQFAPLGELRLNASYQLTRAISIRAGYTAIVAGGIAHSTNMVQYQLPGMGIIRGNNNQTAFMEGVNFGIEINR